MSAAADPGQFASALGQMRLHTEHLCYSSPWLPDGRSCLWASGRPILFNFISLPLGRFWLIWLFVFFIHVFAWLLSIKFLQPWLKLWKTGLISPHCKWEACTSEKPTFLHKHTGMELKFKLGWLDSISSSFYNAAIPWGFISELQDYKTLLWFKSSLAMPVHLLNISQKAFPPASAMIHHPHIVLSDKIHVLVNLAFQRNSK